MKIISYDNEIKVYEAEIIRQDEWMLKASFSMESRGYTAPEEYGVSPYDIRSSIYRIGVMLYYFVTGIDPGKPPYELYPVRQVNPSLSKKLEKIIKKCIQRTPEKRYQSYEELISDLDRCMFYRNIH